MLTADARSRARGVGMRGERLAHSENEIDWRGMCTGMLRSERPHLCSFPSVHVRRASLARAAI